MLDFEPDPPPLTPDDRPGPAPPNDTRFPFAIIVEPNGAGWVTYVAGAGGTRPHRFGMIGHSDGSEPCALQTPYMALQRLAADMRVATLRADGANPNNHQPLTLEALRQHVGVS